MIRRLLFIAFVLFNLNAYSQQQFVINKSHLDYLTQDIVINGKEMAIVHIYCNAPDYNYVDDSDEGYACVDDAARAGIFYLEYYKTFNDSTSLLKYFKLVDFLLYMQSENGYFYNFIWPDNTINKDGITSKAEANWWSWRAFWCLIEGYDLFSKFDPERFSRVDQSVKKLVSAIKQNIPLEKNIVEINGFRFPEWLPFKYAADQSALLIITLTEYYEISKDEQIRDYINLLADGIMQMQLNDDRCEFNGAFLSWENTWHGWGNSQSYSLLKAYQIFNNIKLKNSAIYELDNFYRKLIEIQYLNEFSVLKGDCDKYSIDEKKYSQIAYIIRPIVFSLIEAYKITNNDKYAIMAGLAAKWLIGNNPSGQKVYNEKTGIVYDGIESNTLLNKNSGAESTIEALLILLKISQNKIALNSFLNY